LANRHAPHHRGAKRWNDVYSRATARSARMISTKFSTVSVKIA
jgi:hypothetical protein